MDVKIGGFRCENKIDSCSSLPCQSGVCIDNGNCTTSCLMLDNCKPNNCKNDALCLDVLNDYACKCPCQYYSGKNCEVIG